jgi:PPOX class probable F420-dependent enzyme
VAHVATGRPDGEPQSNPVRFDCDGEHVKCSQTTTRQKYCDVQRDPRTVLSIVDPEYRYLEIRGVVDRVEEDPDLDVINSMSRKYGGMDEYQTTTPAMSASSTSSRGTPPTRAEPLAGE